MRGQFEKRGTCPIETFIVSSFVNLSLYLILWKLPKKLPSSCHIWVNQLDAPFRSNHPSSSCSHCIHEKIRFAESNESFPYIDVSTLVYLRYSVFNYSKFCKPRFSKKKINIIKKIASIFRRYLELE